VDQLLEIILLEKVVVMKMAKEISLLYGTLKFS
jgi:hypothetical protein